MLCFVFFIHTGALRCVFFIKYYLGDQSKKTEMGRACSTYWESRSAYRVLVGNLREGTTWKTQA
jgi:hypothetical protein